MSRRLQAFHVRNLSKVSHSSAQRARNSSYELHQLRTKDADKILSNLNAKNLLILPVGATVEIDPTGKYFAILTKGVAPNLSFQELKAAFVSASAVVHERHPERLPPEAIAKMHAEMRDLAVRLDRWL